MKYPHLAARIFNTPLLIHPQKLDAIIAGLGGRLLGAGTDAQLTIVGAEQAQLLPAEMFSTKRGEKSDRGYVVSDGVAVIRAYGALVHRSRLDADSTYMLGYNELAGDIEDAMRNPDVHALALVYDSPGGEAQGAFEFAHRVRAMRGQKPMIAVADGMAASAAYMGASAADEIVVTSTAYAGSIGVVMRHVDFSRALSADGIQVTHIFAGAHKVDGNPYEPLPREVRADMQAEIDGLYEMFVNTVSDNRRMDAAAVRATQARVYRGEAAVNLGLADRVGTVDEVISQLAAARPRALSVGPTARANATDKGASMSGNTAGGQPAAETTAATAAPTIAAADLEAARAEGRAAGVTAERERTAAILGHERATANLNLALQCITAGLTIEQSSAILGALPATQPAAAATQPANAFAAAMAAVGNPSVSGIEAAADAGNEEAALAQQVLAAFRIA